MKIINFFTILVVACFSYAHKLDPYAAFIETLEPVLVEDEVDPFNLLYSAATANYNDTIIKYEGLYEKSKDECMRACYAYSIHLLEITYEEDVNKKCNSKFSAINEEYIKTKPCYVVSPDMQKILDNGNAYLGLFCAKDEKNQPCPFVKDIVDIPKNTTHVKYSCRTEKTNRTKCDETLIQNLSIMSDTNSKLVRKNVTYASEGKSLTFNVPKFNLTNIEDTMRNNTCLVNIEPPKEVLMNTKPVKEVAEDANKSGATTQTMSLLMIILSFAFTTLLF